MKTKSVIIFGLVALVVVLAISGGVFFKDYQKKQTDLLTLEQNRGDGLAIKLHQRDSLVNEYVKTLNQIEKDLLYIKEQENLLDLQSQDPELAKNKRVKISEDIQLIYSLIEENKKKVANLSKKLKNSGVEIAALNKKVKYLSNTLEERDSVLMVMNNEIAAKDVEIAGLNDQKTELETVVMTQKSVITEKVNELNKAYITAGNYRDLKEKGIIAKSGWLSWLGMNKSFQGGVLSDEHFTKIDITETKSYPVFAKKAELITEHPDGSYEWIEENEQIAYMVISDPNEFWKISKYAVLETK